MENSASKRELINNELAARGANTRAKKVMKHHMPVEEQADLAIDFYCECSNVTCKERISMTIEEYEKLHENGAHFIIAKGHKSPTVEKTHKAKRNFIVVEKYAL